MLQRLATAAPSEKCAKFDVLLKLVQPCHDNMCIAGFAAMVVAYMVGTDSSTK